MSTDTMLIEQLFEISGIGFCLAEEEGKVLFSNDVFCQAIGSFTDTAALISSLPEEVSQCIIDIDFSGTPQQFALSLPGKPEAHLAVSAVAKGDSVYFLCLVLPESGAINLKAIGHTTGKYGHDINNLLGAMRGSADLLEHKLAKLHPESNPVARQLKIINSSIDKTLGITSKMRGYARFEESQKVKVSISELFRELLPLIESDKTLDCELILEIRSTKSVLGNDFYLSQALQSIVLNSIEAMKPLSERFLTIIVDEATVESGNYLELTFIDHGCGMDVGKQRQALEPFFSSKSKQIGSGLGLGLPMAKAIIDEHGGELSISSVPDVGTSVRILLPLS